MSQELQSLKSDLQQFLIAYRNITATTPADAQVPLIAQPARPTEMPFVAQPARQAEMPFVAQPASSPQPSPTAEVFWQSMSMEQSLAKWTKSATTPWLLSQVTTKLPCEKPKFSALQQKWTPLLVRTWINFPNGLHSSFPVSICTNLQSLKLVGLLYTFWEAKLPKWQKKNPSTGFHEQSSRTLIRVR